ncbi:MAG: rhodanese-like domain-containing protein [Alcanivoracaceae bacterium]
MAERKLVEESALLVDIREPHQLDGLRFDVAEQVWIPSSDFDARYHELPLDRELIIASEEADVRRAASRLLFSGYDKVSCLEGGMPVWQAKGKPVKSSGE